RRHTRSTRDWSSDVCSSDLEPMIAESWSTERDGATLVFRIRKGAKFPNGRPVTAHAAKYCFDRGLQSPGYMRLVIPTLVQVSSRSEERRVGKESRPWGT